MLEMSCRANTGNVFIANCQENVLVTRGLYERKFSASLFFYLGQQFNCRLNWKEHIAKKQTNKST